MSEYDDLRRASFTAGICGAGGGLIQLLFLGTPNFHAINVLALGGAQFLSAAALTTVLPESKNKVAIGVIGGVILGSVLEVAVRPQHTQPEKTPDAKVSVVTPDQQDFYQSQFRPQVNTQAAERVEAIGAKRLAK